MKKAIAGVVVLGLACFAAGCDEDKKSPEPASSAAAALPAESAPPAPMEPKATPAELQAKTMKGLVDAWNAHDAAKIAASYEPQGKLVIPGLPDFPDRAAIEAEAKGDFTAYSDFKVAVTRGYVHGNTVAIEWVITGKNDGPMMGKPASGRQMGVAGASVSRFDDDGFIKEEHRYVDLPTITSQLDPKAKAGTFRPPLALPAGATETLVSKGTPDEAKTLETAKAMYAAVEKPGGQDVMNFVTDDSTFDDWTSPATMKGPKPIKDWVTAFWKAVPDFHQTKPVQFVAGDTVVTEGTEMGTQKGPIGPLKASNKPVSIGYVDIIQIKDGKAVHLATYSDSAEMLVEIGAMPPLGAAPAPSASAAPPAPSAKAK